ncbi:hypothetical protein NEIRO03_1110 [Nematocida sp. AWRm78]|nr:hypothetical protein NEIRO02_1333 [Nematocida sp. AWRm79]KAI5183520.1 hypothetical protein NEIRO03_1110 [Nematocida sp. AWRm78]
MKGNGVNKLSNIEFQQHKEKHISTNTDGLNTSLSNTINEIEEDELKPLARTVQDSSESLNTAISNIKYRDYCIIEHLNNIVDTEPKRKYKVYIRYIMLFMIMWVIIAMFIIIAVVYLPVHN